MPARLAALALALWLSATGARACTLACPPQELPPDPCTSVRVDEAHVCVFDPATPEGYRIEPRPLDDPSRSDCVAGAGEGCLMTERPPSLPGAPLWRALATLLRL